MELVKFSHPNITFDTIERHDLLGDNIKVFVIKNLDITPNITFFSSDDRVGSVGADTLGYEKIIVSGKTFLAFFHHKYFHQMADMLSRYDYLTDNYSNDLNLHLMVNKELPLFDDINRTDVGEFIDFLNETDSNQLKLREEDEPVYNKYFKQLFSLYRQPETKVFSLYSSNVLFEEVHIIVDSRSPLFELKPYPKESRILPLLFNYERLEIPKVHGICAHEEKDSVCVRCNFTAITFSKTSEKIKKSVLSVENKIKYPDKIFISRKNSNTGYIDMLKQALESGENELAESLSQRIIPGHDEIEQAFLEKGFISIDFEGMDFFEQVRHMDSAKYVCGFSGTSLINTAFCNRDSIVIDINSNEGYLVDYGYLVRSFVDNYIKIDMSTMENFSAVKNFL